MHLQAIALPQRQRVRIRAIHAGNSQLVGVWILDAAAGKLGRAAAQKQRSSTRAHKQRQDDDCNDPALLHFLLQRGKSSAALFL